MKVKNFGPGVLYLDSVQFSHSILSNSEIPWTAAHQASLSITNSLSLLKRMSSSWWYHPTISSSVIPFSCLQFFPAAGSFPVSQFFTWGGQRIGVSASASVLPMNTQDWFPLGWTGWISAVQVTLKSLLRVHPWWIYVDVWQNQCSIVKWNKVKVKKKERGFSNTTLQNHQFFCA